MGNSNGVRGYGKEVYLTIFWNESCLVDEVGAVGSERWLMMSGRMLYRALP